MNMMNFNYNKNNKNNENIITIIANMVTSHQRLQLCLQNKRGMTTIPQQVDKLLGVVQLIMLPSLSCTSSNVLLTELSWETTEHLQETKNQSSRRRLDKREGPSDNNAQRRSQSFDGVSPAEILNSLSRNQDAVRIATLPRDFSIKFLPAALLTDI